MKPVRSLPEQTGRLPDFLARLVLATAHRPLLALLLAGLVSALCVAAFCTKLTYHTQRDDLIGAKSVSKQRWQKYLDKFGQDDDMVVVVQGSDRVAMQAALEALADRLEREPDHFTRVFYKVDLRPLYHRALLYLSPAELQAIQVNLDRLKPLLETGPLSWHFCTLKFLLGEAKQRAAQLRPGEELKPEDEQLFQQLAQINREAARMLQTGKYTSPWTKVSAKEPSEALRLTEPQYFFTGEPSEQKPCLAFLLVQPVQVPGSFTAAEKSVNRLREILQEVRSKHPHLELGLTGLPVLETDEMLASQADTRTASWLALAGVALLYLFVFRGVRYPLVTLAALLVGTAWAMGWLTVTVGHLNILSATFVMMLIGLGDYGVLWVTRYEQERQSGAQVSTALTTTAREVGPSILTAGITTALAFFAAMLADFQAVAELGWIAGSGVLLCAISCFVVIPPLLTLCDRRSLTGCAVYTETSNCEESGQPATPEGRRVWLPWLVQRPQAVIVTSLLLMVGLGVCACFVRYDHNLLHLQAEGLDSVKWELTLLEQTGGSNWHAVRMTDTRESALALKEKFEALPTVSRVVEVASLVPTLQEEKLPVLAEIQHRLRNLPKRGMPIPQVVPTRADQLSTELQYLSARLQPFLAEPCVKSLHELEQSLHDLRASINDSEEVANRLKQFDQWLVESLAESLHQLRDVSRPEPIRLADLPSALCARHVSPDGKWLLQIFGKENLWEYPALERFVHELQACDAEVTGKPFTTLEGLDGMYNGFVKAGFCALGVIVLVLFVDFRRPKHVLLALAPLGMGFALTMGVLMLTGLSLNPANMIALPLIVGVGVDNGVHVLHDYLSRQGPAGYCLSRSTGRGICVAALTTVLGFGTLLVSSHRGLVGLGLMLSLGVSCCMVSALVFLPAALRVWSEHRHRQHLARTTDEQTERASQAA